MRIFLFFLLVFSLELYAQTAESMFPESGNEVNGGIGMVFIDGTAYTAFTIQPELALGKFGVGLNIELLFNNSDGFAFRKTGWDDGAGVFRAIRYLRWGVKQDPLYVRVGSIETATLGHGMLMGYYSNSVNYDQRKIGLEMDIDFDTFGFESMTSNLGNLEIIGGRFYYRPLLGTGIPVVKNLEVGATYVTDTDPDNSNDTKDQVSAWGADIGLPVIKTDFFTTTIYTDFAQIMDHGNGTAVGIQASLPSAFGLFGIFAKLERRFQQKEFMPNYFNTLYELDRANDKETALTSAPATQGIFGELAGQIAGKIRLVGNYQQANGVKDSGILHLEAKSLDLIPNVLLRAWYDKTNIDSFKDVRTLDVYSLANAEVGYKAYKFVYVTMLYRWNFIYNKENDSYEPQERIMPSVSFSMSF